jgi:hypothetical protein
MPHMPKNKIKKGKEKMEKLKKKKKKWLAITADLGVGKISYWRLPTVTEPSSTAYHLYRILVVS